MKKFHIVYRTTCTVTGKFYIGRHSTNDLNDKYRGSGKLIALSLKKYGVENHTRDILEICESRKAAVIREEEIITAEMLANPMCLNLKPGGEGGGGAKWSEESKQRLSETLKGKPKTPEHKARIGRANLGKNTGRIASDETREKLSNAARGREFSAEHCENISLAKRGKPQSEEHRRKIGEARKAAHERRRLQLHLIEQGRL